MMKKDKKSPRKEEKDKVIHYRTRVLSISEITYNRLNEVTSLFHLTQATILRSSVYHGISRLKNGYLPTRSHKPKRKVKMKVSLPPDTWLMIESERSKLEMNYYNMEENQFNEKKEPLLQPDQLVPLGELINIFIDIELDSFVKYQEETDNYVGISTSNTNTVTVRAEMPIDLNKMIDAEVHDAGITKTQMLKFCLYKGLIDEYFFKDINSIRYDYDILKEIERLGLPPLKAMTLIKYLIASNRIKWVDNS